LIDESKLIKEGVLRVVELMAISAKTAPKARGIDNIVTVVLHEREELEELARKMEELAPELGRFFKRDADNVRNSDVVVIIGAKIVDLGIKTPKSYPIDVNTAMALINLGIALGSAVKTASLHNVDNRIMYTIGVAAKELGIVDADFIIGIPLSAKAKNIYFDRKY